MTIKHVTQRESCHTYIHVSCRNRKHNRFSRILILIHTSKPYALKFLEKKKAVYYITDSRVFVFSHILNVYCY